MYIRGRELRFVVSVALICKSVYGRGGMTKVAAAKISMHLLLLYHNNGVTRAVTESLIHAHNHSFLENAALRTSNQTATLLRSLR